MQVENTASASPAKARRLERSKRIEPFPWEDYAAHVLPGLQSGVRRAMRCLMHLQRMRPDERRAYLLRSYASQFPQAPRLRRDVYALSELSNAECRIKPQSHSRSITRADLLGAVAELRRISPAAFRVTKLRVTRRDGYFPGCTMEAIEFA